MADCRQLHNLLREAEILHDLIDNDYSWKHSGTKASIAGDLVRGLRIAAECCDRRQKRELEAANAQTPVKQMMP